MTIADILVGLTIGFPIMIAVGPIGVLLLDQGLERGVRTAAPAVLGVASADLTFSIAAAVGGASIAAALAPVTGWLTLGASAVLVWLAIDLGRSGLAELRSSRAVPMPRTAPMPALVGGGPRGDEAPAAPMPALVGGGPRGPRGDEAPAAPATRSHSDADIPFGHLRGVQLAGAFYGLTMVNPLTIVLFASVVIAGGAGVGTPGWVIGMALASLLAHGAFAVAGGALGTTLSSAATARLRLAAALFMAGLALHFVVG